MNTQTPIYNGLSIRQILSNLPKTFHKVERMIYIKNCIEVYNNEKAGINKGYTEAVKNTNFRLISNHL